LLAQRFGPMAAAAGFDQVLVVTHDMALAASMPSRIRIVRGANGDSRVEVE
jgi:DNA repair exonuclease SbcCD ATPase subunit